jgi:UDP-N-acetyl-D-mannosaminuronic acid dehydrogenase
MPYLNLEWSLMPQVLNIKPEDFDAKEKRSKYTVSVVGCNQRGILWADAFAEAGFTVICTDADQSLVRKLGRGKTPFADQDGETKIKNYLSSGQLCTSSELKKTASESDIITFTLNVKVDDKKNADYSEVESVCKQIGASIRQGSLFIYSGTASLGCVGGLIKETLENTSGFKAGKDFALAYAPFNLIKNHTQKTLIDADFAFAATDELSVKSTMNVLKAISPNIKFVSEIKTLEFAALINAAKQEVEIALANELAVFSENANIDYFKASSLIGDENFYPAILHGAGKSEVYLLNENAENLNVKLRLTALSMQINEDMIKHAVNLTQEALRGCGKPLRRARIAVLGSANLQSSTEVFIKSVTVKGAKVALYDPLTKIERSDDMPVLKRSLNETVEGSDCVVILIGRDQFKRLNIKKMRTLMKTPAVLVDLVGLANPEVLEAEGFIYFGLGRGTGKQ